VSYILTAATVVPSPTTVANGGTGGTTASEAIINLSSPAFNTSAQSGDWGTISVSPPAAPDAASNYAAILELINTLTALGVIAS
jgi:hypothetical protein